MRAQGQQYFFQCIRGVGVVDHHQRLVAATQTLHATDRAFQLGQHFENFVQRVVQPKQGANGSQYVAQVEASQQRAAQQMLALRRHHGGPHTVIIKDGITAVQGGPCILKAIADQARLMLFSGQLAAKFIVQVQHPAAQVRPGKQLGLGGGVSLHRAVVIQMVAGQVGQHGDVKCQRTDAPLIQAMGRNLHRYRFGPGLFQVGEHGLYGNRVWRGVTATLQRAIKTGAQGADDAAVLTQQVKRLGHQLSDAGFAVGASDTYQIQMPAGLTIKTPGDIRQLGRKALDRNQRHGRDRQHISAVHFIGHGSSAALKGVSDMFTTIELAARHRKEQITCAYIAAVEGQFTDQQIVTGVRKNLVQAQGH